MKIARLTFYDEDLLVELKKRNINLGIVNGLLKDFLFKNMNSSDDLSKKKQIIEELEEKKKEIERECNFFSFVKRKKIDNLAQQWVKSYVSNKQNQVDKSLLYQDIESYIKSRIFMHMTTKCKHDDLRKAILKWAYLQKNS
jgi:hypothetical protein